MMSPIQLPISVNSFLKAAGGAGRGADTDAGRYFGRLRIKRNGVFVASDVGFFQLLRHDVAGQAFGAQVDQQQMGVGAAGYEVKAAFF